MLNSIKYIKNNNAILSRNLVHGKIFSKNTLLIIFFLLLEISAFAIDRYWVGGNGTWDGVAGTKWASSSGGMGGASVPTSLDNVYFDGNSGPVTVTVSSVGCKNLSFTSSNGDFTGTFTISASKILTIKGDLIFSASANYLGNSYIKLNGSGGTQYITTNGKAIPNSLNFSGAIGSTFQFQDAYTALGTAYFWVEPGHIIKFKSGTINTVGRFFLTGTAANRISITSTSASQHILTCAGGAITSNCDISYSNSLGTGLFLAYTSDGNIDKGNNSGWIFTKTKRYWVGGSAIWDSIPGNKWAFTSGGAGGAPAPTTYDDVYFDANSGANTITHKYGWCASLICTGFIGILNSPGISIPIRGDILLVPTMTFNGGFYLDDYMTATTHYITTSGHIIDAIRIGSGNGGMSTWVLQDDLTLNGGIHYKDQSLNTNGKTITSADFEIDLGSDKHLILGSSLINILSSNPSAFNGILFSGKLESFDPGTSTIKINTSSVNNASPIYFQTGNQTYNNIWISGGSRTVIFSGSPTFNELKIDAGSNVRFTSKTTTKVNTFIAPGTSDSLILIGSSDTLSHTLSKIGGGFINCDYVSINHSTAMPANTWYAGENSIDSGNNSGWIFVSPHYPYNPYLDVNNNSTHEWNYSGSYQISQITNNFSNEINNFLTNYSGNNSNVQVPIKLHSDSLGILKVKDLDIQYQLTDTIPPRIIEAKISPNYLAKNSLFTVGVKVSDNENINSAKVLFKNTSYSLTQINVDSFSISILADTVGYFPVKIIATDINGITSDTVLHVTIYSTMPDLEILSSNINILPSTIFINDSIHLTAVVKNNCNLVNANVQVALIVDGDTLQTKTVKLNPFEQIEINFTWLAKWGQNKILIKADPSDLISESNENNNTGEKYILVNDIYSPEILQAFVNPNPVNVGAQVFFSIKAIDSTGVSSVTVNWQNQNIKLVYNPQTTFYEGYVNATNPGTSDADVVVTDVNNLTSYTSINIQVFSNLPDLKILFSDVSFIPSLSDSGNIASIQVKIRNSGNVNANNVNLILRVDGRTIGSQSATILHDSSLLFSFPWQVSCGVHIFTVLIDSANVITETNELNNIASVEYQFCSETPSYILKAEATPAVISLGSATTVNLGSIPATSNASATVLWDNQNINIPYNSLNRDYSVQIKPMQIGSYILPVLFTDKNGFQSKTFVQFMVIDSLPDLSINKISTNYPVKPNINSQLTISISNNSLLSVSNPVVYLLEDNQPIDSLKITSVGPFDTVTLNLNWHSIKGVHQLTALIDPSNKVLESNETNNSKKIELLIEDNEPPIIHTINTTSPIYEGGSFLISSNVTDNDSVIAVTAKFMGNNYIMQYDSISERWYISLNTPLNGTFPLTITAIDNSELKTTSSISIHVNNNMPDLEVKAQDIIFNYIDSGTNNLTVLIRNIGGGGANNAKIYLSINGTIQASVNFNFTPGQTDTAKFRFNYPAGYHTVTISVDSFNRIQESNETNNSASRKIFIPDLIAPSSPVVMVEPSQWSKSPNFKISWNQILDKNEIITYEYSINEKTWINVGTNLSINTLALLEGINHVYVRAKDVSGNLSQPGIGEMKFDNTAPNAPVIGEYHCGKSWTTHESPFLEWINPGDVGSGVQFFEVSVDDQLPINIGFNFNYHDTFTSGVHKIKVRAIDYVGHFSEWSNIIRVYIDLDNPDCPSITSPSHPNQNRWYQNDSIVLGWARPTETSSVSGYFYMLNHDSIFHADQTTYWIDGDTLTITTIPSMDANHIRLPDGIWYVHISSQDSVGHISSSSCNYRFKLDKTPPFTVANNLDTVSACSYTFNLHAEDYFSGVTNTYFRMNKGAWIKDTVVTLNSAGLNFVEFYSEDVAGNKERFDSAFVYLIKTNVINEIEGSICQNKHYDFNGKILDESGVYSDTLLGSNVCDSIIKLKLTVLPLKESAFSASICQGESYYFNNMTLTKEGIYNDTLTANNGCDSIVTLKLSVLPSNTNGCAENNITILPNPNNGIFVVQIKSDNILETNISCLNILGQKVYEKKFHLANGELKATINLTSISKGLYLICITANSKNIYKKISITE